MEATRPKLLPWINHHLVAWILFLALEVLTSKGDLFCPPAIANKAYQITAEHNSVTLSSDLMIVWSFDNRTLAECNVTHCSDVVFPVPTEFTGYYFGVDNAQITFNISSFDKDSMEGTYTVAWEVNGVTTNYSCNVVEASDIDECTFDFCETTMSQCTNESYCVHATSCTDLETGFECTCQQGYGGKRCKEGDMQLYCNNTSFGLKFSQHYNRCANIPIDCYVAGVSDQTNLQLIYNITSNNFTADQYATATVTDKAFIFNICSTDQIPQGFYQIVYVLRSPLALAEKLFQVWAEVAESNSPPKFNTPTNGAPYSISVLETARDLIVYVNKSMSPTCNGDGDCIEVIDDNFNQSWGVDSLSINVTSKTGQSPPIEFSSRKSDDILGFFSVSGPLVPATNITYELTVTDGGMKSATAYVIFTVIDVNQPPICSQSEITAELGILSPIGTVIGFIQCWDVDVEEKFKEIFYSLEGSYADFFSIGASGAIILESSLRDLEPGIINFTVNVTGYSDTLDSDYFITIPVYINITVPQPRCQDLTITSIPEIWRVNSIVELILECDTSGVNRLKIVSLVYNTDIFEVEQMNKSSAEFRFNLTVINYRPGSYIFQVTVSLGGAGSTVSEVIPMYNAPAFTSNLYLTVTDISPVGAPIMSLTASTDIPNAVVSSELTSGNTDFLFEYYSTDSTGTSPGFMNLSKSPANYVGSFYELMFQAKDSVSNKTTYYFHNVTVEDTDEPPVCNKTVPEGPLEIMSNHTPGNIIFKVLCTDPDITPSFMIQSYKISTDPPTVQLDINNDGDVTLLQILPPGLTSVEVWVNVSDTYLSTYISFRIRILVFKCLNETDEYGLFFPDTPVNSSALANCPASYSGQVSRFCNPDEVWGLYSVSTCRREILDNITNELVQLIENTAVYTDEEVTTKLDKLAADIVSNLNNMPILAGDIKQMAEIFINIGKLTKLYRNATVDERTLKNFVTTADILIGADQKMWTEAQKNDSEDGAMVLDGMDSLAKASVRKEIPNDLTIVMENIAVTRASTDKDILFPNRDEPQLQNSWVLLTNASVFLPKDAFKNKVLYSVILYNNATEKFRINPRQQDPSLRDKVLNSNILSFTISDDITNLSKPLVLSFSTLQDNYSKPICGFLDTKASLAGQWSLEGCSTEAHSNSDRVNCSCNHTTNFAILMSPYMDDSSFNNSILSIISTVGCAISIFCLFITIVVYLVLWKYVKCDRCVLHLNLCVCLILAYIIFLAGVDRTENTVGCKVVASLLHYIYLVVFCVMLSEGVEIFKSVSFVFSLDSILWKLLVFSYGVPVIIVAISLGATKTVGYGSKTSCWLSTEGGLIWAFVGPVLLIILINLIILIQVLRIMQKSKQMEHKPFWLRTKSAIRTICVLSPLLGLTWVFGVLSVNRETIVFQYLFAIFNSLQGLMIFICYCLISYQVRDGVRSLRRKHHAKSFDSGLKSLSKSQNELRSTSDFRGTNSPSTTRTNITHRNSKPGLSDSIDDSGQYSYSSSSEVQARKENRGGRDWQNNGSHMQQKSERYGNGILSFENDRRNDVPTFQEINASYRSYEDDLLSSRCGMYHDDSPAEVQESSLSTPFNQRKQNLLPRHNKGQGHWKKVQDATRSHYISGYSPQIATRFATSHGDVTSAFGTHESHNVIHQGRPGFQSAASSVSSRNLRTEPNVDYGLNS